MTTFAEALRARITEVDGCLAYYVAHRNEWDEERQEAARGALDAALDQRLIDAEILAEGSR